MMKPICIIPARAGSRGVPNKNIRLIAGKPLIYYTIKSALESKLFSHVIVSTEDKKTASIAKKYGAEVPFMRPRNLATNKTPQEQVLLHAVKKLNSLGIFGNHTVVASVYILAPKKFVNVLNQKINIMIKNNAEIYGGSSILPNDHGLLIRLLCNSSEITKTEIYNIVRIARKEILGVSFTEIRKT